MAGVDVSTLQVKVVSDGIKETSKQLSGLSTSANNADKRITKLTDSIDKLMWGQKAATNVAQSYNAAIGQSVAVSSNNVSATNKLIGAMQQLVSISEKTSKNVAQIAASMNQGSNETDKNTKAVARNTMAMKDAHAAARGLTGSLGALWLTYGNFTAMAMGAAIGAGFAAVVKSGKDVEHTLEGIRVRGAESYESVDKLRASVMELGKGVYGPQEVADAFNNLIMAGLNAEQAAVGIKDALNLAVVGGTSVEKASYTLVQVGTALGYTAEGFGRVGDVIAKTAAVSMSSVESLSESFKSASAVGKLYGASITDIGVALAALSNLGISGSAAGTSLKNFYKELSVESNKLKATLADMKMVPADLLDANGKFLDMVTVIQKLSDGLDKLNPAAQAQAIQKMSNERGMKTIVELLDLFRKKTQDGSTALHDMRKQIEDSYAYAAFGAAQLALTADSQFKSVKNTLTTSFVEAFKEIQPQMLVFASQLRGIFDSKNFRQSIQEIATALANLAVAFADNIDKIKYFAIGLLVFKTFSIIVGSIASVTAAMTGLATVFGVAGAAARGFHLTLGILGAALLAAGAAWAWYHTQKSGDNAVQLSAKTTLDEMNKGLDTEIDRLKKVNAQLALGVDIKKADAAATRDQMIAMAYKQRDEIKGAAQKELDTSLADIQARKSVIPKGALGSGKALADLTNEATKAQEKYNTRVHEARLAVADTVIKTGELAKQAKTNAEYQEESIKRQREAATAGAGTGTLSGAPDKAGIAAANRELNEYNSRMESLTVSIRAAQEAQRNMLAFGKDYDKVGEGAKKLIQYQYELEQVNKRIASGNGTATDTRLRGHLLNEIAAAQELKNLEQINQGIKERVDAEAAEYTKIENRIARVKEETIEMQAKVAAYGQLKGASDELVLAELRAKAAGETDPGKIEQLNRLIAETQKYVAAKKELGVLEANTKALDKIDKALDPGKAMDFGAGFAKAFGGIGGAIDNAAKALDQFGKKQKKVMEARDALNTITDEKQRLAASNALRAIELKNTVDMYGDMAGAVKGFFSEKTAAYKIFDAVERGMRIAQLALSFYAMQQEALYISTITAARTSAASTSMAISTTQTGVEVGLSATRATAFAAEAVAKCFAVLGPFGFIAAAAVLGFLVSMGIKPKGGGGGTQMSISEQRQKSNGTGTVLGDDTKKSESISKALDILKDNSNIGLDYTSRMLSSLRSINDGISGMAAAVSASAGLRGTAADEKAAGVGASKSFLGFSSSSTTLTDSGLLFSDQRLGSILAGASALVQGYQDIEKKKSSFFGLSKSSSSERRLSDVNGDLQRQIDLTIRGLASGTQAAAEALGLNGDIVARKLQDFTVSLGAVSLKGLSGEDVAKELQAAFSRLGDTMAESIVPGFREFQRVGEGGFETLVRLASGVESAKMSLDNLGVTMIAYQDIVNKQGDVEAELIRQSIALKESGTNIAAMMYSMDGAAEDLIDTYKKLLDLRSSLKAMSLWFDVTTAMIRGSGDLDSLLSNMNDFVGGFFSEAEQQAIRVSKLKDSFAQLGLVMPTTKEAFRAMVEQLMRGGERTQDLGARVLALSGAFEEASSAIADAQDEVITSAQDALSEAYDKESGALTDLIEKMKDFSESIRNFRNDLITGDMSPLSATEKYQTALKTYNETYAKAMAGDAGAIEQFQAAAQELLQFSKTVYASGDQYMIDFQRILAESEAVAKVAETQVDVATQQLNSLKEQVGKLIDIDESVKTVAQAIADLTAAMANAGNITMPIDGSHAGGLSSVPFDGYIAELHKGERVLTANESKSYGMDYSKYTSGGNDALIEEIKALRSEVSSLRQEQADQTNRMIGANYDAQERNAQDVVGGIKSCAEDSAYASRTQPALN